MTMKTPRRWVLALVSLMPLILGSGALAQSDLPCSNYRLPIVSEDPQADSWVKQYLKVYAASTNSFESAIEAGDFCASQISSRLFNPANSAKYIETLKLLDRYDPTGEQGLGVLALRLQKDWEARYLWTYNAQKQNEMGTYRTRTMLIGLLGLAFQPIKLSNKLSSSSVSALNISRAIFGAGNVLAYELAGKRVGIDRNGIRLTENVIYTPPAPALFVEFADPAAADLFAIDGQWQEEFRLRYRTYNDIALGFAIHTAQGFNLFNSLWTRLGIAESSALAQSGSRGALGAKIGRGGAMVGIFLGLDYLVNDVALKSLDSGNVRGKLDDLQLKRNEYEITARKLQAAPQGSPERTALTREVYRQATQFAHLALSLSQHLSAPYLKAYMTWLETDELLQRVGPTLASPTADDIREYRAITGDNRSNEFQIARKIYEERASSVPQKDLESFEKVMQSYGKGNSSNGLALLGSGYKAEDIQKVKLTALDQLTADLRAAAVGGEPSGSLLGWLIDWFSSKISTPTTFADPAFTPYLWFQFLQPPRHKSLNDANLSNLEATFLKLTPFDSEDRKKMDQLIQSLQDLPDGSDGKISPRFATNVRRIMDLATEQLAERAAREKLDLSQLSHDQKLDLWRRALFEYRGNLDRILAMWLQQNNLQGVDSRARPDHILLLAAATLRNVLKEASLADTPLYQEIEYLAQTTLTTKAGEYDFLLRRLFGEIPAEAQDKVDQRLWSILKYNSSWFTIYDPRGESPPMDSYMYVSF